MKKYLVLFAGVFMFSACAAAPVRQVAMQGDDYYVSIGSFVRPHHHKVIVPARPKHHKHIHHAPKPPKHFSPWRG